MLARPRRNGWDLGGFGGAPGLYPAGGYSAGAYAPGCPNGTMPAPATYYIPTGGTTRRGLFRRR
jgi:hypothetical protein